MELSTMSNTKTPCKCFAKIVIENEQKISNQLYILANYWPQVNHPDSLAKFKSIAKINGFSLLGRLATDEEMLEPKCLFLSRKKPKMNPLKTYTTCIFKHFDMLERKWAFVPLQFIDILNKNCAPKTSQQKLHFWPRRRKKYPQIRPN
jgi:hypothetical protein